ncbi:MAG: DUF4416 family protein [Planctomycetota bacterium]
MAQPRPPQPVKLICGLIATDRDDLDAARAPLIDAFGPVDLASEVWPFDLTDYYADQMGSPLVRQFVAFEPLVTGEVLADAKLRTNAIEADFAARASGGPARPINLDVGYVTPAKLVLASMKNFAHRIYLSGGIYAEITLQFRDGAWRALEWTFPDYASGRYDAFLSAVRNRLNQTLSRECSQ